MEKSKATDKRVWDKSRKFIIFAVPVYKKPNKG